MSAWTCSSCAGQSPAGTRFCGLCGAPATESPAPLPTWTCRECGTSNPAGHAFCGGCGSRMQATRAEELRLVTALFADISGFTTLADSLDVESLHEVITPLVGGLTRIAERYEGFVEKFAGDALLVVYGAPVTHEDDAQRALLTALEMHAELPRLLAGIGPHAEHLSIHIGVNTGRVIGRQAGSEQQSDYAVLGDSVILAQRLESVCPGGQTYVGPMTYELCRSDFEFESVGELTLKGKLKPVQGHRLLGPRRTAQTSGAPLVGRDVELAAVEEGLSTVAVTTLLGEPGVGKTRLLTEVRERALARGTRWLAARCLSYGAALAYWPISDLLRQALELRVEDGPESVEQRIEERLPAAARPGARRLLALGSEGSPETARREIHDAVASWLQHEGPSVLALEDVHWADRSTVDLLAELARTRSVPVRMLLTGRDEGRAAAQQIAGETASRVVELGPLAAAATAAVAGAVLQGDVGPGLRELLVERTSGNPLHVTELTRSLAETGELVSTLAGWDLRPGWDRAAVPTTIERVFATRLDTLAPPAAALLQLTSVIGRTVRLSLLRLVDDDLGEVDERLAVLLDAGMLVRTTDSGEPAVTFSHALLQEVVYERLLRKRRRDLHRRVADVARSMYGDGDDTIGLLARHLYLADAGEEAVEPLLRAGRLAAGVYANDAAVLHLERAVTLLESLPGEGARLDDARLELAQLQERRGVYDAAQRLYELRRQSDDDPRAWRGLIAVQRSHGDYDGALRTFVEACRRLDPREPSSGGVWVEAGWTLGLVGRASDAVSVLLTALRLLGRQDPVLRAELLCQLVDAERLLGRLDAAVEHAQEAVQLSDAQRVPATRGMALRMLSATLMDTGRLEEAVPPLREAIGLAERTGALDEAAGCLLNLGLLEISRGNAANAVQCTREAVQRFEKLDHRSGRAIGYCNLADALHAEGRLDDALQWCEQASTYAASIGHGLAQADALRTRARIELARGNPDAALEVAQQSATAFAEHEAVQEAQVAWELAVQAAQALGNQAAVELAERAAAELLAQR